MDAGEGGCGLVGLLSAIARLICGLFLITIAAALLF